MKHRFRFVRDDVCGTVGVRIDKIWKKQNRLQKTEHWKISTGTTVNVMLTIRLCIVATKREQKMSRVLPILFNMKMIRAILNERKVVHG